MTTMVWINVLLAIPFIALWAGIPLWLVLRRPDTRPQPATARSRDSASRKSPVTSSKSNPSTRLPGRSRARMIAGEPG